MSGYQTVDELPPDGGIVYESLAPLLFVTIPGDGRFLVKRDRLLYPAEDVDFEALGGPVVQLSRGQFMQRLIEDMHDGRQLARGHVEIAADLPMDNPANVAEVQDRNISAAITLIQRLLYERMLEQDMSAWKAAMRADGIGGDAEPDALPSESVKMAQQLAEQHRRRQAASPPPLPSQYTMRQLAPGEGVLLPSNTARTTTDDDPRLRGSGDIGAKHRMQFFDAMLIGIGLTALGYVARQILSGLPLFNLDNMPTFAGVVIGIICGGIVVGAFIYLITDSSQGEKPAHRLEETTPKSQPESPGDTP